MSYCQWSSDSFRCDLYCYGDVHGGWTAHVAGCRRVMPDDFRNPLEKSGWWELEDEAKADLLRSYREYQERLSEWPMEDIDLPSAGKTFNDPTLGDFRARVVGLIEEGFRVPDWVLPSIDEEITEVGADYTGEDDV